MANNVRDFDLELFAARRICAWPMCEDAGLVAIGRCYDKKRLYHCPRHHSLLIGHPETYEVVQDRDLELGRWEGEGGRCS